MPDAIFVDYSTFSLYLLRINLTSSKTKTVDIMPTYLPVMYNNAEIIPRFFGGMPLFFADGTQKAFSLISRDFTVLKHLENLSATLFAHVPGKLVFNVTA